MKKKSIILLSLLFIFILSTLFFAKPIKTKAEETCTSWTYSDWGTCSSNGQQTRTVLSSSPESCSGGSPILNQSCTPTPQTCTSWTYSDWGTCSSNGQQTRTVLSSSPESCSGGSPILNQSCTPTPQTCTSWTYSDWGTCSSNGQQTRTVLSSSPESCSGGSPILNQSCTPTPQTCTSWTYSDWGTCSSNGQQTRTVLSSSPESCSGGSPILNQSCTPTPQTCTSWTYSDWGTCSSNGQQTRTVLSSSPESCSGGSPILNQSCTPTPQTCTSWTYSDWGTCSSNGQQTRTVLSSSPSGCFSGNPVLSQSCSPISTTATITSISPRSITPGDVISIYGSGFGDIQGNSGLTIGGYKPYGTILSWTNTQIQYKTSAYWDGYSQKIGIKKCKSYYDCQSVVYGGYFYIQPKINSLSYYEGSVGTNLTIYGSYLQNDNVSSDNSQSYTIKVYFNGVPALYPTTGVWTKTQIDVSVPFGATSGSVSLEIIADTGEKVSVTGPHFDVWEKISNDEYSSLQKYFKQINLPQAWGISNNNRAIIVAVIDDGVYNNHPDLKNKMWTNTKEILGNGIDDDRNGYIDDVYGWDFVYNTKEMTPLGTHGTMVAGIIGAEKGNNIGIAGVNNNAKIMPLIVCDKDGCANNKVGEAIRYAVNNGAEVINISLGTGGVSGYTTEYDEAIKYAYDHNVLVVAAAGNGDTVGGIGYDLNQIPQSPVCNNGGKNMIIGVGASNGIYRTNWSNYGTNCVDIYAPGVNIVSTAVPAYSSMGGFYDVESGTSFSSPIVAGVVSLLKATYPTLTSQEAINLLINGSNNGIIDAYKTLSANFTPSNKKVSESLNNLPDNQQSPVSNVANSGEVIKEEKKLIIKVDNNLAKRVSGKILLQVEKNGEGWYVYPDDKKKYYLGRPADAFSIMRNLGLGIKHNELTNYLNTKFPSRLSGKILLDVEKNGEAYYINPKDLKGHYLNRPMDAFRIMRELGLGITNIDVRKIDVGEVK